MGIARVISKSTKYGVAGGVGYYAYELGLWKNSNETLKNYDLFKKDVNGFLESSPALVEYAKAAGDTVQSSIKPVAEPVSNFRKEWLNFDLCEKTRDGVVKTTWNKGVELTVDAIAATPKTVTGLVGCGWYKVKELTTSTGPSSETSSS